MGATHFRAISESEIFSSCGERVCAKRDRKASAFAFDAEPSACVASYRCSSSSSDDEEDHEVEPPSELDDQRLADFLASQSSKRRQAVVVEAATFDNGVMAAMCTKQSGAEIQQHAAVLSPSELEFWGVDSRRACGTEMNQHEQAGRVIARGLAMAQLDWIWEDTLHACKVRGIKLAPEEPVVRCSGCLDPYVDSDESEASVSSPVSTMHINDCQLGRVDAGKTKCHKDSSSHSSVLGFLIQENAKVA